MNNATPNMRQTRDAARDRDDRDDYEDDYPLATTSDPEIRDILFELLPPTVWHIVAEMLDNPQITFPAARAQDLVDLTKFMQGITQHEDWPKRVKEQQQRDALARGVVLPPQNARPQNNGNGNGNGRKKNRNRNRNRNNRRR